MAGSARSGNAGNTSPAAERVADQLWLRSVMVEQWRRTPIVERPVFDQRADRILAALDPQEDPR